MPGNVRPVSQNLHYFRILADLFPHLERNQHRRSAKGGTNNMIKINLKLQIIIVFPWCLRFNPYRMPVSQHSIRCMNNIHKFCIRFIEPELFRSFNAKEQLCLNIGEDYYSSSTCNEKKID